MQHFSVDAVYCCLGTTIKKAGVPSLHIFRPSLLLGDRQEFRLSKKPAIMLNPLLKLKLILQGGLPKFKPLLAADAARAMAKKSQTLQKGCYIQ